jgi:hypothetical protein
MHSNIFKYHQENLFTSVHSFLTATVPTLAAQVALKHRSKMFQAWRPMPKGNKGNERNTPHLAGVTL